MNILLLSELVKKNGSRIGGDYRVDQINAMTTSPSEPPVTTDDFMKATKQGKTLYMYRSFYTEEDDDNKDAKLPKKDKEKKNPKKAKPKKKIKEEVFTKKEFDTEFVQKKGDILSKSEIPGLESLRETNPILIRKVSLLKDVIEKNNSSGEEIAIILNYLLSTDLKDMSTEYKNILKNKLN